ncbi:GMC oxidoreductase-domain-containing protein [Cristinia sonorae]|uniref:GMC oxidoreductase-domain-containing protein n=1 Tax=Cristinia sonorae TaxID=1940300 RepID=A0A8K0UGE1_9AGAR|nr:GMC oxidoreductase-domain-containing protein [Cristinia sonorae]
MANPFDGYDIIFAGGGTTACLVAGRLITAEPALKILIIESGPRTLEDNAHVQPARFATHLQPTSRTINFMVGKPSVALDGRTSVVPTGQCLGGGSSVNFTMYTRPVASDYDEWELKYSNPGWGFKDMLPFIKKVENYQIQPDQDTHGYTGPLSVSMGGLTGNVGSDFLEVATKYDPGRGLTEDPNAITSGINKYGRWQKWINSRTGRRSDVPHNFIYPHAYNKNLVVNTEHVVKRVIFEGKRAVGIEFLANAKLQPGASQKILTARAKRLVVVSGGSCGTPLILERSGIGGKEVLRAAGVDLLVDLPGVGATYQDHTGAFPPFHASEDSETLDGIVRGKPDEIDRWTPQWLMEGSGAMAWNGLDAGIKMRPNTEELNAIGPEFMTRWNDYFANAPDKPVLYFGTLAVLVGDTSLVPDRKYFTVSYFAEYPASIGSLHITSGDDVYATPDFDPSFLTKPEDIAVLRYGYKVTREFARRMKCYRGEYKSWHPQFPNDSEAACHEQATPVPVDSRNIRWTAKDDEAIDQYHRAFANTCWHSLGTCPMKPREKGGVVDTRLNVYGVEGLKVADLSIAPSNVSANTYSTTLAIAEKAAAIIAEELGIQGV